jgi:putative transcriptional regulator
MKNRTATSKQKRTRPGSRKRMAPRLLRALGDLAEALERGDTRGVIHSVRTVEVAEPDPYDAAAVRAVRAKVGASQAVFGRVLGVSAPLVRAWEQGTRRPSPLARRLMDEINAHPDRWAALIRPRPAPVRVAEPHQPPRRRAV